MGIVQPAAFCEVLKDLVRQQEIEWRIALRNVLRLQAIGAWAASTVQLTLIRVDETVWSAAVRARGTKGLGLRDT